MEDLYKDDPNSWMKRARFSKTVYRRPDPSQLPFIPIEELKRWHSDLNSKWAITSKPVIQDNTSKTSQSTTATMSTLKLNQNSSITSKVQEGSDSKTSKPGKASKRKAISDMFKEAKKAVRRQFVGPPSRDRTGTKTVMSASGPKGGPLAEVLLHPVSAME